MNDEKSSLEAEVYKQHRWVCEQTQKPEKTHNQTNQKENKHNRPRPWLFSYFRPQRQTNLTHTISKQHDTTHGPRPNNQHKSNTYWQTTANNKKTRTFQSRFADFAVLWTNLRSVCVCACVCVRVCVRVCVHVFVVANTISRQRTQTNNKNKQHTTHNNKDTQHNTHVVCLPFGTRKKDIDGSWCFIRHFRWSECNGKQGLNTCSDLQHTHQWAKARSLWQTLNFATQTKIMWICAWVVARKMRNSLHNDDRRN